MKHILVFDVGTTSVKTTIYDEKLKKLGDANREYRLITREGGIVELAAETYWETVRLGLREAAGNAGIDPKSICAVSVTTQGETLIPVGRGGNALTNAVVWLDGRAVEESRFLSGRINAEKFYSATGIPELTGQCPISKLLWIKNRMPEVFARTYKFMLLEDYLIMKLTGRFVTEKSLLSTTGYYDIVHDEIIREFLSLAGADPGKIPTPLECGEIAGGVSPEAAHALGLSAGTAVVTAAMDQVAGAVGAGNLEPSILTETTGTAMCAGYTARQFDCKKAGGIPVYRHAFPGNYLILSVSMTAGIILKWFKDEFCEQEAAQARACGKSVYELLDALAEKAGARCGGLLLLPYFSGVIQPENNPDAKGVFFGVGLETGKKEFVRSILESVAYMLKENVDLVSRASGSTVGEIRSLGGGSKSPVWNQIKADINGIGIATMSEPECTSLGAAALAAAAMGFFATAREAVESANHISRRFLPDSRLSDAYREGYAQYRRLYQSLKPMFSADSGERAR